MFSFSSLLLELGLVTVSQLVTSGPTRNVIGMVGQAASQPASSPEAELLIMIDWGQETPASGK